MREKILDVRGTSFQSKGLIVLPAFRTISQIFTITRKVTISLVFAALPTIIFLSRDFFQSPKFPISFSNFPLARAWNISDRVKHRVNYVIPAVLVLVTSRQVCTRLGKGGKLSASGWWERRSNAHPRAGPRQLSRNETLRQVDAWDGICAYEGRPQNVFYVSPVSNG